MQKKLLQIYKKIILQKNLTLSPSHLVRTLNVIKNNNKINTSKKYGKALQKKDSKNKLKYRKLMKVKKMIIFKLKNNAAQKNQNKKKIFNFQKINKTFNKFLLKIYNQEKNRLILDNNKIVFLLKILIYHLKIMIKIKICKIFNKLSFIMEILL